jgi:hypothetical protein
VANIGSARTDAEMEVPLDQARGIVESEQVTFDIEVPMRPTRMQDVPDSQLSMLPALPAGAAVNV